MPFSFDRFEILCDYGIPEIHLDSLPLNKRWNVSENQYSHLVWWLASCKRQRTFDTWHCNVSGLADLLCCFLCERLASHNCLYAFPVLAICTGLAVVRFEFAVRNFCDVIFTKNAKMNVAYSTLSPAMVVYAGCLWALLCQETSGSVIHSVEGRCGCSGGHRGYVQFCVDKEGGG